jgi:hypothetical protein
VAGTFETAWATTAGTKWDRGDSVTNLEALDIGTNLGDRSAELVTHYLSGGNEGAFEIGMQIRSTNSAFGNFHDYVIGSSNRVRKLVNRDFFGTFEDCCFHVNPFSMWGKDRSAAPFVSRNLADYVIPADKSYG